MIEESTTVNTFSSHQSTYVVPATVCASLFGVLLILFLSLLPSFKVCVVGEQSLVRASVLMLGVKVECEWRVRGYMLRERAAGAWFWLREEGRAGKVNQTTCGFVHRSLLPRFDGIPASAHPYRRAAAPPPPCAVGTANRSSVSRRNDRMYSQHVGLQRFKHVPGERRAYSRGVGGSVHRPASHTL